MLAAFGFLHGPDRPIGTVAFEAAFLLGLGSVLGAIYGLLVGWTLMVIMSLIERLIDGLERP